MKLEALTSYGILPAFIERWRAHIGDHLLDWQADALMHYGLLDPPGHNGGPCNLLVVAPTSSGKTFIGELAAAAALSHRKKVLVIVPLKAIAAEKHHHLDETLGTLGFNVVVCTRDHRHFDSALVSGDFDVAVVVAEKLRHLLVQNIDLLARVELIVADELHLLSDPERGPALLSVLEKLARADFRCRLIGLSTRLPAADALARLLHARILRVCRRPVELRRGVLCDGRFRFREDNSGEIGIEPLGEPGEANGEALLRLLDQQVNAGEQILVFGKTKTDCHYRAAALAQLRTITCQLEETEAWVLSASGPVVAGLADWYARGIGVHHADLSFAQRRLTEQLFREGKLRVLFCTGTLAMGVNLPASVVYVEAERFAGGRYGNAPFLTALEPHEFDNAAGRAGRLGLAASTGRAILCAATPVEADILWETYITGPHCESSSAADGGHTLRWPDADRRILEAVACHLVIDRESCARYFSEFSDDSGGRINDVDRHLARLIDSNLLSRDDSGKLCATPDGLIAAGSGVSPDSMHTLRKLVTHANTSDPILWAAALIALPESADLRWPRRVFGSFDPMTAAWREQFGDDFESTMARSFPDAFRPEVWYPRAHLRRRAMAAALAIGDWAKGDSADMLAATHQAPLGRFEQTAETISWLVETIAALAEADPHQRSKAQPLWKAAFEIRRGLPFALRDLAEAIGIELPREALVNLARLGWNKPESLAAARGDDFHGVFPDTIADSIIARARRWVARHDTQSVSPPPRDGADTHTAMTCALKPGRTSGLPCSRIESWTPACAGVTQSGDRRTSSCDSGQMWTSAAHTHECRNQIPEATGSGDFNLQLGQARGPAPRGEEQQSANSMNGSAKRRSPDISHSVDSSNQEAIMSGPLTLDGRSVRSRFVVALGDSTCALRAKSFKYLFTLAAARLLAGHDGWVDKRDVEPGENQIKYFYQLRQELKAAYDGAQQLIENDGSGRYRLALPPERIRFNLTYIADFPDWEIQKTAQRLSGMQADFKAA